MQRMTETNFGVILTLFVKVIDRLRGKYQGKVEAAAAAAAAAAAELPPLAREAQILRILRLQKLF